jgi:hypothetical protein
MANPGHPSPQSENQTGFTDESLRMLETEEGQLNAVFACFGSAAQRAQLFEESLAKFLVVYNKIFDSALSLQDLEMLEAKLQKKTMGSLLRELSNYVTIQDESVARNLDEALRLRNFLMHNFFISRDQSLKSVEGRLSLLAELVEIGRILEQSRIIMNAMRIAMCETLGFQGNESAT